MHSIMEKVDQLQRDMRRFKDMLSSEDEETSEDEAPAKQRRSTSQVAFQSPSNQRQTSFSSQQERKRKNGRTTVLQLNTVNQIDLTIKDVKIERLAGESKFTTSCDAF